MFAFQIQLKESGRIGSVVSQPVVIGDKICVPILWDDDFSFSTHPISELIGVMIDADVAAPDPHDEVVKALEEFHSGEASVLAFPTKDKDDDTTH